MGGNGRGRVERGGLSDFFFLLRCQISIKKNFSMGERGGLQCFFFTKNPNLKQKKFCFISGGGGGGGGTKVSAFFLLGIKSKIKEHFFFSRGGGWVGGGGLDLVNFCLLLIQI